MSIEEANKALVRRFIEYINNDNSAPIDEFVTSDYSYHNPSMREVKDLAAIKQLNAMIASAFPDMHFTIEDIVAEGEKVVYRYSARGTHQGHFMGIAPTGKEVTLSGIVISRIINGKLREDWECADELGLMQQLGAVPQLSQSRE
jgi:predicted ester cyclase